MKTNDMNTAIYPHSAAYAKEHGELEQYRALQPGQSPMQGGY